MEVWTPKYNGNSLTREYDEWVALLHVGKVAHASPVIIVTFPKAKHLQGQRFAIRKQEVQSCAVGTNGTAPMYEVPWSRLESYETAEEIKETVARIFND